MKDRHQEKRIREIFGRAHELEGEARQAFLDRVCGDDEGLRHEVESLLAALEDAGEGCSATPGGSTPGERGAPDEQPGAVLGPYKLLQRIGEGGMGSVFMAEQQHPVKRRVALKIVRQGLDSKQVIARFEAERQALALMDHPNIARVLDAGETEAGRPYFVMELVKGKPITEYCDEHNLSIEERLELFVPVCQAVQHAHQKGVIHRDIKPSNVLVSEADGRAIPKVIDFGIAKATTTQLTDKTLFTEFQAMLGTPEYMSPEQAEGSIDIDTRADVYGLGVLLYELLVGVTPFDPKRLRSAALQELLRILREDEPPRPSTRASEETRESSEIAAHRRTEPRRLGTLIRGELDWVVMKCLEKDRARRYETATSLALDIQRYLRNEPTLASPPRMVYRLRKFVRRNKGKVTAAAAVLVTLIAGIVGTGYGLVEAKTEARNARDAETQEKAARQEAELRSQEFEAERDRAKRLEGLAKVRTRQVQHQLYGTRIRLAMVAWRNGEKDRVRELLEQADPEQRGWEWDYLQWLHDRGTLQREIVIPHLPESRRPLVPAYSADLSRVAIGDGRGRVEVSVTEPMRKVCEFQAYEPDASSSMSTVTRNLPRGPFASLQFTADGARLVSFGSRGLPSHVWDARTGDLRCTLARSEHLQAGTIDPAGKLLVGLQRLVWNLDTGRVHCELEAPPGDSNRFYRCACFSRDGSRIFAAGDTGVYMWRADTGGLLGRIVGKGFKVASLRIGPDGRTLIVTGEDAPEDETVVPMLDQTKDLGGVHARVYDYRAGKLLRTLPTGFAASGSVLVHNPTIPAFSPNGRYVASPRNGRLQVFDFQSGRQVRTYAMSGYPTFLSRDSIRFTPGGDALLVQREVSDPDRGIVLRVTEFEFSTPEEVFTIHTAARPGHARLRFAADGKELFLLRGYAAGSSATYDTRQGHHLRMLSEREPVAVSRDGRRRAVAIGRKPQDPYIQQVQVTDCQTGEVVQTVQVPGAGAVTALDLSPDGSRLVAALGWTRRNSMVQESATRIFDVGSGRPRTTLHGAATHVLRLAFAPDGETVVAWDSHGNLCAWDPSGRRIVKFEHVRGGYAFSADGRRLLVSTRQGGRILDPRTGEELVRLSGWRGGHAAAFHPGGERVVTADLEDLKVWDATTGSELLRLHTTGRAFVAVAFDGPGKRLAALTEDGDIAVWECQEPDATLRRTRQQTSIRQRAAKLVKGRHRHGVVGEALARRLDELQRQGREDPEVIAWARGLVGQPDRQVAEALNSLIWVHAKDPSCKPSEHMLRGAAALVELSPGAGHLVNTWGVVLYRAGQYERALEVLRKSDRLTMDESGRPRPLDAAFLAMTLVHLGKQDEAWQQLSRAAACPILPDSDDQKGLLEAEEALGASPIRAGNRATVAKSWLARAEFRARHYGEEHRLTGQAYRWAASWQSSAKAREKYYRKVLEIHLASRPDVVPVETFQALLRAMRRTGRLDEATTFYKEMLAIAAKGGKDGKPTLHEAMLRSVIARHLRYAGNYEAAREMSQREVAIRRERFPTGSHLLDVKLPEALQDLGFALRRLARQSEAETVFREVLEIYRNLYGERDKDVALAHLDLAGELCAQDRHDEAGPHLDRAIAVLRSLARPLDRSLATALVYRGICHTQKAEWGPAARFLGECLAIRKRVLPQDSWYIYNTMSKLGHAKARLGDFEAAEPLLLEAATKINPPGHWGRRKREAVQCVVEMYDSWEKEQPGKGHAAKAAQWRKRLPARKNAEMESGR